MNVFEKIKYNLMILAEETYYKSVDGDRKAGERNCAYHKAIKIVEKVAEEYNNGWIPCSERLPDENIAVDVTIKEIDGFTYTEVSWLQNGIWVIKKNALEPTVIAWKERPEPYKEKGE